MIPSVSLPSAPVSLIAPTDGSQGGEQSVAVGCTDQIFASVLKALAGSMPSAMLQHGAQRNDFDFA
jgi:hypothetical protein